ncbi:MAG TPA: hypothetical protein VNJ01_04035 [Bacteriovoracaceae bacterium]|nr:hypothetical protein [Bacteriovoracaceae bacterium]
MLPRSWPSQFFKSLLGTVLTGLCLSVYSQDTPLATGAGTVYPGIIETFEKIIQIDSAKLQNARTLLTKNGKVFSAADTVTALDLDPVFLNSLILHSDPGYLKLASMDKCRFYEALLTDLLKSSEGKVKNVIVTYLASGKRETAVMSKKDFLDKVVSRECPQTQKMISLFQIKTLGAVLKDTNFELPTGAQQCSNIHLEWLNNPKTPFLCQIYEYGKDARSRVGDPKEQAQKSAVAKILESKQTPVQRDYLETLCTHLDDERSFCEEFLNVSFWSKVSSGVKEKVYVEDICRQLTGGTVPSAATLETCLARIRKENDLCLFPRGTNSALSPQPECDRLSLALNHSSLRSNYQDCPGDSDQLAATNLTRIIANFTMADLKPTKGPCSAISAGEFFNFNKTYDNEENWTLEACYTDKISQREICTKTFFGEYGILPESYTLVVAEILKKTRGADPTTTCEMVDSTEYNPLLLRYKSGCFIIYQKDQCYLSECKHKILYNDRTVDLIKIKNRMSIHYFPLNVRDERFSQHYMLTHDFKKKGTLLNNLTSINRYFKKNKTGLIHGIGCAEDLLPTFFKSQGINHCQPLPFIIDGVIYSEGKTAFVTRTAVDSLQAPRILMWTHIFSGVKTYQRLHPLKIWTMYGLD